ncbi:hypothetical protein HaLaN_03245 [Haematococcus lacustris]|uniref:Uncharacterized protein n=1 Tax=Haematococcus lacustris TaxID=44745 RepID=A0A699YNC9_HAELA|nr:hypothetical protein HaLaN_03245 [Haematococcus lacustris]
MLGTLGPGSHLGAPRLARHQQCPNTRFSRRIACAQGSDRGEETLSTLDSLLGNYTSCKDTDPIFNLKQNYSKSVIGEARQAPENKAAAQLEPLVEWWKIRPKQNAPPRQSGMTSGSQGRFILNEVRHAMHIPVILPRQTKQATLPRRTKQATLPRQINGGVGG